MQQLTNEELHGLESDVGHALRTGDLSQLNILGFGEISVALGYPASAPTHACKRTPPFTPAEFTQYAEAVHRYVDQLRATGLQVVESEVRSVSREGSQIAYLVQPLLDASTLGHKVLGPAEPDPEHPFVSALAKAVLIASRDLSIDAQVTNWSWDGSALTLLDVGTPFLWDAEGTLAFDMDPFLVMLPAPTRGLVKGDLTKMINRWREPSGVALDVVANLFREGLDQWVDPMIVAFNDVLGGNAVDRAEAQAMYDEDLKTWPRLAKLKQLERTWRTKVRRKPYDFFIQTTYATDSIS